VAIVFRSWDHHPSGTTQGVFQPNAPGGGEMRTVAGLRQRQLLKGATQHLAERVGLAVSDDLVTAWQLGPRAVRLRELRRWPRGDVFAVPLPAEGVADPHWPAFVLVDARRLTLEAELRALRPGRPEREVLRLLCAPSSRVTAPAR
jgi:hypothetical protein